ncbi:unnamed protein product, partial [Ectocarpus sp. 4 AP-2014]
SPSRRCRRSSLSSSSASAWTICLSSSRRTTTPTPRSPWRKGSPSESSAAGCRSPTRR